MSSLPMTERTSEPTQAAVAAAVNNPLLRTTIPPDLGAARHILEEYSGIAPEDVNKHLLDIVSIPLFSGVSQLTVFASEKEHGRSFPTAASHPSPLYTPHQPSTTRH